MESAIKHGIWALSAAACVYSASTYKWIPVQITLSPGTVLRSAATPAPPSALGADAAQLLAAQLLANARVGAAPVPGTTAPANTTAMLPPAPQAANFALIEDKAAAGRVSETLGKLEAVADLPAGTPAGRVVTIFFDPRCPYCHAAFKALHGKVAVRWVPVVVLGEPEAGNAMAAAILSAPDRVAALGTAFGSTAAPAGTPSPEMLAKVAENREAFAGIFAASPTLKPGVPTLFVPRPDGRMAIMVGYEAGDDAKLAAVLAGS